MITRALAKRPEDRYGSAHEFAEDVRLLLGGPESRGSMSVAATRTLGPESLGTLLPSEQPKPNRKSAMALIAVAMLLLVATVWFLTSGSGTDRAIVSLPERKHVAVLPFETFADDRAVRALSDGLVETITSKLTQLEHFQGALMVVPSSEVRSRGITSAEEARRIYGANLVVTGHVQRSGNTLELWANLVDADRLLQVGSKTNQFAVDDLAALRDGTVGIVVSLLELELTPAAREAITASDTDQPS
ncbi:MAG: hypothetical protein GY953_56490, partial [bacterium]|nr:hypothetical protein [bacterium]